MHILVTGGTGRVGGAVVDRLVDHAHDVLVIGRRPDMDIPGASYQRCDVTDYDGLVAAMRGREAVVHLAAIPDPIHDPSVAIFDVNCLGTYKVYEAAIETGISRVVVASSINALGQGYAMEPFEPAYFPIDEDHPTCTRDPYAFSKQVIEEMAGYFWRRNGITSVCLRIPGVGLTRPGRAKPREQLSVAQYRGALDAIAAMPQAERVDWLRRVHRASREQRYIHGGLWQGPPRFAVTDDATEAMRRIATGLGGFWTSVDARDSAQAFEKSLLVDLEGAHTLFVNRPINTLGIETERLLRVCFPTVRARTRPLDGCDSLISIDRARALIGYAPEFAAVGGRARA